jgi:lipoic acid synthetase
MSEFRGIPVVTTGTKYQTEQGFAAIKNGVKARPERQRARREPKPPWLKARVPAGERFERLRATVREHRLATVCEESICPNIGECWNHGTATIMLMGKVCTRACQFCAVDTGNPRGWLDLDEAENSARTVELMGLRYVVLTSVDRDDLPDGGARHYADCIRAIKARCPQTAVEALTPDFAGNLADVATVVDSGPDVFAQNLETVERLTSKVRDARAGYAQTLAVLQFAKRHRPDVLTKSSLMLGLGRPTTRSQRRSTT